MDKNARTVVMGILAIASIAIGGVLAILLGRGCSRKEAAFPVQEVPNTVEPDFVFSAPDTCGNGGVKSVRKSFPDGSDRLVHYYTMKNGKKILLQIYEYYEKGVRNRETVFLSEKNILLIKDRAWFPNGFLRFSTARKVKPGADGFDYSPEAGVLHGEFVEYRQNGVCFAQGIYADGKREGVWHEWNEQGIRVISAEYTKGVLHGIYRKWGPAGAPVQKGTYRNGKKAGTWTFYKKDGSPPVTKTYPETGKDA